MKTSVKLLDFHCKMQIQINNHRKILDSKAERKKKINHGPL